MNNKIHVTIEIALLAILISVIIQLRRSPTEARFLLKDGGAMTVKAIGEEKSGPGELAIYLNSAPGHFPFVVMWSTGNQEYNHVEITNNQGDAINADYGKDGVGPTKVWRSLTYGGKRQLLFYNDAGEIEKKADMPSH